MVPLAVALGVAATRRRPRIALSPDETGDSALAARVKVHLATSTDVRDRMSISVIDGDDTRIASFGATADTEYEVGSVTKTMTASLLQEMIERDEVSPDARLGDFLDLGDSAAASVTLEDLATHHSGLPRLPDTWRMYVDSLRFELLAKDPYRDTLERLVMDARATKLGPQAFEYSNFGYALLGQALAASKGSDYSALLQERIFAPLGMSSSFAANRVSDLAPGAPTGFTESGRRSDPWVLGAYAPGGSVRSTLTDLTAYVRAQLDGTAPGVSATEPRIDVDSDRIGYAWFTTPDGITWHNGTTGGFSSWIGFDRANGRGAVVLSNTASDVDGLGFALVRGDSTEHS
ncbi:hypothetical protein BJF80_08740 [Serinicoccus sp. CUA-874]|nr:hypothetical protein BJF80_08740 [Serinicoccus sp. CUA-874]OLT28956.1 hypothetical protein BJF82_12305 [Kytococcus sp. CUA-901]